MISLRIPVIYALAFAISSTTALAQSASEATATIVDLIAANAVAFNSKDAAALAALFTEDADYLTHTSYLYWWRGRDEIEEGLELVLSGPLALATRTLDVEKVRFLTSDIAIVHVWENTNFPDAARGYQARGTAVVTRVGGEWRFSAMANSRLTALGSDPQNPGTQSPLGSAQPLVSSTPVPTTSLGSRDAAAAVIRNLAEDFREAYNSKDASRIVPVFFHEDADFVTANAYLWQGAKEIEQGLQFVLSSAFASMTWTSMRAEKIRFLEPNIAIEYMWQEGERGGASSGGRGMRVLLNDSGGWRIIAHHNAGSPQAPEELRDRLPGISDPDHAEADSAE